MIKINKLYSALSQKPINFFKTSNTKNPHYLKITVIFKLLKRLDFSGNFDAFENFDLVADFDERSMSERIVN